MFQLKIYDLMQKEQDFMANKVMFLSSKGWITILPHHAPLFTDCLPEKIIFSVVRKEGTQGAKDRDTTDSVHEDQTVHVQEKEQSLVFKNPGFLSFDGKVCQIWIS